MTTGDNRKTVLDAMARFGAGDLDGYLETLYDPSIKLHGYSPEPLDHQGVRAFYEGIFAAFSDMSLVSHDEVVAEDKVVTRFTLTGRHTGDFMGIPPTGRTFSSDGITILRFAGGKCVERWSVADFLGMLVQLGAVELPAS
jgi:predicted ester cyclase